MTTYNTLKPHAEALELLKTGTDLHGGGSVGNDRLTRKVNEGGWKIAEGGGGRGRYDIDFANCCSSGFLTCHSRQGFD